MKPPADGWDRDEREAIEGLQDELTSLQARHRSDPPIDLLRAARHDALPPDLQAAAAERLSNDAWSRALVDGLDAAEPVLEAGREDQLLARIKKDAAVQRDARGTLLALPRDGGAAAAAVIAAAFLLRPGAEVPREVGPAAPGHDRRRATDAPFRAAAREAGRHAELEGVDLARRRRRQRAARRLEAAARRVPPRRLRASRIATSPRSSRDIPRRSRSSSTAALARLFLNEPEAGDRVVRARVALADETFASRIAWYRAVAEERAGNGAEVRRQLETVCRSGGERSREACTALARLGSTPRAPDAR